MNKYVIEFIGTFFLVLTVGMTGDPVAIGAVLAVMVYAGGYISGGHYNPAVTLGVFLQKKIAAVDALVYWLVQLVAAIAAAGMYQAMHGGHMVVEPGKGVGLGAALLVEMIFTFLLVSTVLHTAVSKQIEGNQYYGLAIGLSLMVGAFAGGAISGGAFNPAVGIGPTLYNWSTLHSHLHELWLYSVGPLAGGLLAGALFMLTVPRRTGKKTSRAN